MSSETKAAPGLADKLTSIPRAIGRFCRLGPRAFVSLLLAAFDDWNKDNASRLGASLSFYTVLSLAPLLVVILSIASLAYGRQAAEGQLMWQISGMVGQRGAEVIQAILQSVHHPMAGTVATTLSVIAWLFGASSAAAELRSALNLVWDVPSQQTSGIIRGIVNLLRDRFFALLLVMAAGMFLLASLFLNAIVAAVGARFQERLPLSETALQWIDFGISFLVMTLLFGAIYKFVPDVEITWEDVSVGAAVTSLLFSFGKYIIGIYLGHSGLASAYGAAGSLVVLLLWLYYSAQVFFFGAEFTQIYSQRYGSRLQARRRLWQQAPPPIG
jgi:membrane protein